jgi:uncharacterized protein (DUF1697 family)
VGRYVVLLRGINVGKHRQLPMADLKQALDDLGYTEVRTHLRSGNVVLSADGTAAQLEEEIARAVEEDCGVAGVLIVVRTRDELAEVIEGNPFREAEDEPKKLQVTFLSAEPSKDVVRRIEALDLGKERVAFKGREVYSFHAAGLAESPLAKELNDKRLGVTATGRNWNTVTKLLELADAAG